MYSSPTTTREQALVYAAAAERAMERHACCKSQFKFKCFSCGEFIKRGDKITKCTAPCWDGMRLRFRGADAQNGLTVEETAFYLAETGTRTWVHIGCNPCFWDSLPEDSPEHSPPALRSAYTDWGAKITYEFEEWRQLTNHYDMEEFLEKHGYPEEKWMKDRINKAVTGFQALWRGHLYKKAFPLALEQKRAEDANIWRGFLEWCGSLPHSTFRSFPRYCEVTGASAKVQAYGRKKYRECVLYPTIKKSSQSEPPLSWRQTHNHCDRIMTNMKHWDETLTSEAHLGVKKGYHFEFIFDIGKSHETIYSGVVTNVGRLGGYEGVISVRFHYDDEVRHYQSRRFFYLENQCKEYKKRRGLGGRIMGKLKTVRNAIIPDTEPVNTEDWRYHYPDGNPVE